MAIINKRLSINLFILNVRLQLFGCAIDEGPVVKYFHYSCVVSTKSEIRDSVLSYIYWIEFSFWIEREREMDLMIHSSTFLLPQFPADNGPSLLYALVLLNQPLPKFTPLLWNNGKLSFFLSVFFCFNLVLLLLM